MLPTKDSATWRAIITGLQALAGFIVALVAIPEVMNLITEYYPEIVPIVVAGAGIASFLLNLFRKDVKNW